MMFLIAINMKKDRIGYSIQVILPLDKREYFRKIWFKYSNTIGVRERVQKRWILLEKERRMFNRVWKDKSKTDIETRWIYLL